MKSFKISRAKSYGICDVRHSSMCACKDTVRDAA
jgi:hypothetical protein